MAAHATIPQGGLLQLPNQVTSSVTLCYMETFPSQNMQWLICCYLMHVVLPDGMFHEGMGQDWVCSPRVPRLPNTMLAT